MNARQIARSLVSSIAIVAAASASPAIAQQSVTQSIEQQLPELMELYRDLHANPELSGEEHRTAAKLAGIMRGLGFEVTEGVGGTGVVAVMKNGEGPTVLLRADMDGLPVTEATGLPFASKVTATDEAGNTSGVMHACGHDTHMTGWVGAARQLAARKGEWSGTLVMIAQPAEEKGLGAKAMLEDGLFTRFPKPDYAVAFHDAAQIPAGVVGYASGFALANVDSVDITVRGVGGHGAYPHTTKDPVVLAAAIVGKLQTLVSREVNPQQSAVVTVGTIHGGSKRNVIPDEVTMGLTVRSYSDETRTALIDGIARIAKGEAIAAGIPDDMLPVVTHADTYTPATYNTPELAARLAPVFAQALGEGRVMETPAVMGGEDFGRYRRADPDHLQSMIVWVGGVPADNWAKSQAGEMTLPSLHSALWAPDAEKVVSTGATVLTEAALELMKPAG
ncbi:amidohydrolase [Croceicoccus mobilis]|uniref:Amidohydrolase n=1 Tax=Croceicoccus mobilis TaxID=1703339 RepID=A0A916YUV5_9SPHN|nr:amidohydrolase [Croceicoccus mobilis]GGD62869.1 putative amidohydrolase [Croceicoccus mobilis]